MIGGMTWHHRCWNRCNRGWSRRLLYRRWDHRCCRLYDLGDLLLLRYWLLLRHGYWLHMLYRRGCLRRRGLLDRRYRCDGLRSRGRHGGSDLAIAT